MDSSKKEIHGTETDLKIRKKARFKKLARWLLVDLAVAAIIFALLLYRPGRYKPADFGSGSDRRKEVSLYLTNNLLPAIHNGSQYREPFELVVTQKGINDIIIRGNWPMESEGVLLYAPAVLFVPGTVVLMGTVDVKGVEFVVTIELEPKINEQGFLNLHVGKMKVGAMNITPLAKMMAKKMYMQRINALDVDTEAVQTKIAASLLNDEPFEPVFRIDDNRVRIEKITVAKEKLLLRLVPAS
jgi:hypothetical protein